jgi:hypothetical protein
MLYPSLSAWIEQFDFSFSAQIDRANLYSFVEIAQSANAAERDMREYVTRRKISGSTESEMGRKARDIFVGIKKNLS